jgi:hypothetical protein
MLICPHCGGALAKLAVAKPRKAYDGKYKGFVPLIMDRINQGWCVYDISLEVTKLSNDTRWNARQLIQQSIYNIARTSGIKPKARYPSTSSRNADILRQRLAGMTFKKIGEVHGIGPQRVREIVMRETNKAVKSEQP